MLTRPVLIVLVTLLAGCGSARAPQGAETERQPAALPGLSSPSPINPMQAP